MTVFEHIKGIWSLSGGVWLIYGLYISIRIERYIVKRYEQETDLLDTVYFREHATFTRYLPNFFSSALYTSHLFTFLWGWNYFKKKKPYRDIKTAEDVIRHFSKREIHWVKWFVITSIILFIHGVAYYIFRAIWPEVFN